MGRGLAPPTRSARRVGDLYLLDRGAWRRDAGERSDLDHLFAEGIDQGSMVPPALQRLSAARHVVSITGLIEGPRRPIRPPGCEWGAVVNGHVLNCLGAIQKAARAAFRSQRTYLSSLSFLLLSAQEV